MGELLVDPGGTIPCSHPAVGHILGRRHTLQRVSGRHRMADNWDNARQLILVGTLLNLAWSGPGHMRLAS